MNKMKKKKRAIKMQVKIINKKAVEKFQVIGMIGKILNILKNKDKL